MKTKQVVSVVDGEVVISEKPTVYTNKERLDNVCRGHIKKGRKCKFFGSPISKLSHNQLSALVGYLDELLIFNYCKCKKP